MSDSDIDKLKGKVLLTGTYKEVAQNCTAGITVENVAAFFNGRSVSEKKQKQIVRGAGKMIKKYAATRLKMKKEIEEAVGV